MSSNSQSFDVLVSHLNRRCGHVSMLLLGSVQLGFRCVIGSKKSPMYCMYLNSKGLEFLCVKNIFKKNSLWLACSLDSHFSIYWDLNLARIVYFSLLTNVWRIHMAPSCVVEGALTNQ